MDIAKDSKHNKYFLFIAYLQIIGIVLVVLGHSFHEYPDGHHGDTMLMYKMLHSFRMPLFIFVSGFLLVKNVLPLASFFAAACAYVGGLEGSQKT